jgi:hypothetical protein
MARSVAVQYLLCWYLQALCRPGGNRTIIQYLTVTYDCSECIAWYLTRSYVQLSHSNISFSATYLYGESRNLISIGYVISGAERVLLEGDGSTCSVALHPTLHAAAIL